MLLEKTNINVDVERLISDARRIISKYNMPKGQIGFTNTPKSIDPYESIGSLARDVYHVENNHSEDSFTVFNPEFKDTIFYELWKSMPFRVGRMRLHILKPKECYSVHRDAGCRWHFALISNPGAYIWFTNGEFYQVPVDGYLYKMNATQPHTAFNGGWENRVHLVFSESTN